MTGAHQRDGGFELLIRGAQFAPQRGQLAFGQQLQMIAGDGLGGGEAGCGRLQLLELQQQALADRARADARRVEHLHDGEHALDFRHAGIELGLEAGADDIQRLAQVAVIIDRIDHGAAYGEIARIEPRQFELPEQMVAQRLAARVGELLLAILIATAAAPGILGRAHRLVGPAVIDDLDRRFLDRRGGFRRGFGAREGLVSAALGVLILLEHDVRLEQFADMRLQLDGRQLQQADGLLQLRRHRQLLSELELQRGLKHKTCLRPVTAGPRDRISS